MGNRLEPRADLYSAIAAAEPFARKRRRLFERGVVTAVMGDQADVRVGFDSAGGALIMEAVPVISGYLPAVGGWVKIDYEGGHSGAPFIVGPSLSDEETVDPSDLTAHRNDAGDPHAPADYARGDESEVVTGDWDFPAGGFEVGTTRLKQLTGDTYFQVGPDLEMGGHGAPGAKQALIQPTPDLVTGWKQLRLRGRGTGTVVFQLGGGNGIVQFFDGAATEICRIQPPGGNLLFLGGGLSGLRLMGDAARVNATVGTNDDLVLNAKGSGAVYINFDAGAGGLLICDGSGTIKARVTAAGNPVWAVTASVPSDADGLEGEERLYNDGATRRKYAKLGGSWRVIWEG